MSEKKNEIIVLAQSLEQPRVVKRITELSNLYKKVIVFGFNRNIHKVNNFSALENFSNVEINIVGNLSNSQYLNRLKSYFSLVFKIYKNFGLKKKNIYVFGLDLRMLTGLILNKSITYEISDIVWLYSKGVKKIILRNTDYFLTKFSNQVAFTSYGFYKNYYKPYISENKISIKENKFKSYGKVKPIQEIKRDKIRVAYIGAFRYSGIIKNLISTLSNNEMFRLDFYGDCHNKEIIEMMKKAQNSTNNIFFHGPFKNPDDLEEIYENSNVNFVAYDNTLDNEKVAMPNKYYESGFFNIPIICSDNTYLSDRVLEHNMGWSIGISEDEMNVFFNNLTLSKIEDKHNNIKKLDKLLFEA
ncbi:hypothetical protein [Cellulophaga omnivescoria]|uniref:hypothetical protein n=1 Tax=Cellulophaga omnivescoria TaxID=1888890 RepID=UPI0009856293|nr:hypothetical protein [Cellulophaga omnivescoria]WBU88812.1 hypothetical protein PBN93_13165 [Cellulophaga omnivescoria]